MRILPRSNQFKRLLGGIALGFGMVALSGCSKQSETDRSAVKTSSAKSKETTAAATQISVAEKMLKAGETDKAAAQLMQVQAMTPNFSPKEAANYRQTMQDVYAAALEAAQKGDPKAQAALQMLKASAPR